MQIKSLVHVHGKELRAGTWLIAEGFNRRHQDVTELVEKYRIDFEDFSCLKQEKLKSTGGRPVVEYLLTEGQAIFLGTLFKNNEKVVQFKKKLVKEFLKMRRLLDSVKVNTQNAEWIEQRYNGKKLRLESTEAMKAFIQYAKDQGSTHADKYYMAITTMANKALFIVQGKFTNLRNVMTARQLMVTGAADGIIDRALLDGMRQKMFYKDIYKQVRDNVQVFAGLHGQSAIIDDIPKELEQ